MTNYKRKNGNSPIEKIVENYMRKYNRKYNNIFLALFGTFIFII